MDKYEEYFRQAKDKLRFSGVGGVSMPNPDLTPNNIDPIKVDPNRQLTVTKGWVMVGGQMVKKRKGGVAPVQILGISQKLAAIKDLEDAERSEDEAKQRKIEERLRANAPKKNNQSNNTNNQQR